MNKLLLTVLSDTFLMYFKAQSYHWNIEGSDWFQYHTFFGDVYKELWEATDVLGENIRVLNEYAPISLEKLYTHRTLQEDVYKPIHAQEMIANLHHANDAVLHSLRQLLSSLSEEFVGLANVITDRITIHEKYKYMLTSLLKE